MAHIKYITKAAVVAMALLMPAGAPAARAAESSTVVTVTRGDDRLEDEVPVDGEAPADGVPQTGDSGPAAAALAAAAGAALVGAGTMRPAHGGRAEELDEDEER